MLISVMAGSNVFTCFYTSYICSLKYSEVYWSRESSNEDIFGFIIVPDNGSWNAQVAKNWLKKPKNTEWREEVTDRYYVKWSPETVHYVAYGFRLKESYQEDYNDQLVSR